MPDQAPTVAVIAVVLNSAATVARSLQPLRVSGGPFYVVVVDNGSRDDTVTTIRRLGLADAVISNDTNRGYGAAVNQALAHLRAQHVGPSTVVLLDPDCFVAPEDLRRLAAVLDDFPRLGAVSVTLRSADGAEQITAHQFRTVRSEARRVFDAAPWDGADAPRLTPAVYLTDWVVGACLALRPEALDQVGGIAERYFVYVEDIDTCYRLRIAGWGVAIDTSLSAVHLGGHSLSSSVLLRFAEVLKLVNELAFYESAYSPARHVAIALLRVLRQLRTGDINGTRTVILLLACLGLPARWIGRAFLRHQAPSVRELIPAHWLDACEGGALKGPAYDSRIAISNDPADMVLE